MRRCSLTPQAERARVGRGAATRPREEKPPIQQSTPVRQLAAQPERAVTALLGRVKRDGEPQRVPRLTAGHGARGGGRSEEHTSELQSRLHLVCRLLLEK